MLNYENSLSQLYVQWSGYMPDHIQMLPRSGSDRIYFRLTGKGGKVIGVFNHNIIENEAFISFTNHFRYIGLPVPQILSTNLEDNIYLLSDLGDITLFHLLTDKRKLNSTQPHSTSCASAERTGLPDEIVDIYRRVLDWLPVFQIKAGKGLNYGKCHPRAAFDRQSMMWDMNYFKYYFLKLAGIQFDEQALENDFESLCALLLQTESDFFLYRDFQSRNIMIINEQPWFIDYQGGRRGALPYDLASLLNDAKADLPFQLREELIEYYLKQLEQIHRVDYQSFYRSYYPFALIRILQAMGAYGFRGYYEHKTHFLLSIPYAVRNLKYFRDNHKLDLKLPALIAVIDEIIEKNDFLSEQTLKIIPDKALKNNEKGHYTGSKKLNKKLTVSINSFSYKRGIPQDDSGNGGGFVFDCRALPNPGRQVEFKGFTGIDQPVIEYLKDEPLVKSFLENCYMIVNQSVDVYLQRGFTHLQVSFGCTGGQHRSVYCASQLAQKLQMHSDIQVEILHVEQLLKMDK